jgi:hypothetical protein
MRKRIAYLLAALAGVWLLIVGAIFVLMLQPPDRFARGMSGIPEYLFPVVPFRRLWTFARRGPLDVGDPAPDFRLETPDRKGQVTLSSFKGEKPVVLIFGSYT